MSDNYTPPSEGLPVLASKHSWCATCPELIRPGDQIVKCQAGWQCVMCNEEGKT